MDEQKRKYELWHRDPSNWRAGVFYFNRKDPRLIVPKRNPMLGWTLNFANPLTYLILLFLAFTIAAMLTWI